MPDHPDGALVKWDGDGTLALGPFSLMRIGLLVNGEPTFEEWERIRHLLALAESSVHWWIGDWLNYGERRWGERYAQALDETDFEYQTLANDKYVAEKVTFSRRREKVPWSHHAEVASLPPEEQDALLSEAEPAPGETRPKLSLREIREKANFRKLLLRPAPTGGCTLEDLALLVEAGKTFGTIYADPPWQYGNQATRAATDNHYSTMTAEELAVLPVPDLAADPCHLHLWTTNGFLAEALSLIESWGFTYKSLFVWCKPQIGIGNYWRVSHELLLLGVRGEQTFLDKSLRSWEEYDRTEHSVKPEQVRRAVEAASPGPYLELFGRRAVDGWTVWGNEISRDLFTQHVEEL